MYVCMYVCTRWRLPDRTCKAFLVRCGVDRDSCASKPRGANRSTNVNPARFFFCSCDLQVERGQRASKDKRLLRHTSSTHSARAVLGRSGRQRPRGQLRKASKQTRKLCVLFLRCVCRANHERRRRVQKSQRNRRQHEAQQRANTKFVRKSSEKS